MGRTSYKRFGQAALKPPKIKIYCRNHVKRLASYHVHGEYFVDQHFCDECAQPLRGKVCRNWSTSHPELATHILTRHQEAHGTQPLYFCEHCFQILQDMMMSARQHMTLAQFHEDYTLRETVTASLIYMRSSKRQTSINK